MDDKNNIILTYRPDTSMNDTHCMIRWNPDGTGGEQFGPGAELCAGTPHGLRLTHENGIPYLYHANNAQKLHKTRLDGTIVWSVEGRQTMSPDFFRISPPGLLHHLAALTYLWLMDMVLLLSRV